MHFRNFGRRSFRSFIAALIVLASAPAVHAEVATLKWNPSQDGSVSGYMVRYRSLSEAPGQPVDVGAQTSWSVDLAPGIYAFAVRAYNHDGNLGPFSEEVVITLTDGQSHPELSIDRPVQGVVTQDLLLAGWAIDRGAASGTGIDQIHVYAYPNPGSGQSPVFLGIASYGSARPDVAAVRGEQFIASGYSLPVVGLQPGNYLIAAYAHSTVANAFNVVGSVYINVDPRSDLSPGVVTIDGPTTGQTLTSSFVVRGWAIDRRARTGTGMDAVQVWAYPSPGSGAAPIFLGNAETRVSRRDVGAVFGSRFNNSGWNLNVFMLAGTYDLVVLARSTVTHTFEVARVVRVVVAPPALVAIDSPTSGQAVPSVFTIGGWAADRRATVDSGIDVLHVWAYPNPGSGEPAVFVGAVSPTISRPDVGAHLGAENFTRSGWNLTVTALAPGTYDLAVYAHSSVSGKFENAQGVRVTVQ